MSNDTNYGSTGIIDENGKDINFDDIFSDECWEVETTICPICSGIYVTDNIYQNHCVNCGHIKED